jgi:hypothetical protein
VRLLRSAAHHFANRNAGGIAVVTTATRTAFRDEVAHLLCNDSARRVDVDAVSWLDVLPDEPNRLFERGNFGVPRQQVPIEDGVTTELPTPLPRHVRCDDSSDLRWLTDVDALDWSPLRHPDVSRAVLNAHGF